MNKKIPINGKSIKITFDARMAEMSGIGRYIRNILPYLCDEFSVTLLSSADDNLHYLKNKNVICKQLQSEIYSLREQIELASHVDKCDIFWSPHYNVPLLPVKADKRIVSIHDVYPLTEHCEMSPLKRFYAGTLIKKAIRSSDIILTGSQFAKKEIIARTGSDPDKVHSIYLGVDTDHFKKLTREETHSRLRNKFHLPERFILFVGNVKPNKNLVSLLTAISCDCDISVVIAGRNKGFRTEDTAVAKLLEKNKNLSEKTFFTEHVCDSDIIALYNMAEAFVFPSFYEGFGLPVIEAQACGCPVLASSAASMPEVGADSFLFFDPHNIKEIRHKIRHVIDNHAVKDILIKNGNENVKRFSWDKTAQSTIETIYSLF